jgi:hypothetical protein
VGFVSVYRDKTNCRKQCDLNAKRPKIKLEKMDFLFEKVAAFPRKRDKEKWIAVFAKKIEF